MVMMGHGGASYLLVLLAVLLTVCLSTPPLYQEVKWSEAVVEVTLNSDHAHSDTYGHAHIRSHAPNSLLKVTMENRHYQLKLTPTKWLVSSGATITRVGVGGGGGGGEGGGSEYLPLEPRPCLYLAHSEDAGVQDADVQDASGTVSLCHRDGPRVLLMIADEMAELLPLQEDQRPLQEDQRPLQKAQGPLQEAQGPLQEAQGPLQEAVSSSPPPSVSKRVEGGHSQRFTHVVKRHPLPALMDQDCQNHVSCARTPTVPDPIGLPDLSQVMVDPTEQEVKRVAEVAGASARPLTVELGLFLDQALIELFSQYLSSEEELVDLVIALVNNVQALYRHPSLGRRVDLTITHLRLLNSQPKGFDTHNGDRSQLLKSFCGYNQRNNDPDDANPDHWDIGVYLSGLNFFVKKPDGTDDAVTMGLAYTGGVCKPHLSCVINELGAVNYRGRPYPSSGALSSYVLAHEIGHSLGLRHDGVSNKCARSGFIMAAGRGLKGATTWSSCARDKILMQDGKCLYEGGVGAGVGAGSAVGSGEQAGNHTRSRALPGQRWDATAQCQLFLKDPDAVLADVLLIHEVCSSVTCTSPRRISSYLTGPALEGTHCGGENWCRGGECVPWGPERPQEVVAGGWGPWTHGDCTSGCVEGATGYQESRRLCDQPPARNSVEGCVGVEVRVSLCSDEKVCGVTPRKTVNQLASELCQVISKIKPDIDGVGRQLAYSADMGWQACALYCQMKNSTSFWTPRYEFRDLPHIATHLPDGTPCNSGQFVCFNRRCVSKLEAMQARTAGSSDALPLEPGLLEPEPSLDYLPIDVDNLYS